MYLIAQLGLPPNNKKITYLYCRSQWSGGLNRRSTAARLLRSWVRIPPGTWMFAFCVCCVFSGRGLCDELITRPEEYYQLWHCVITKPRELGGHIPQDHSTNVNKYKIFKSINPVFLAKQPPVGQELLIHEVSRSHTTTHHSR